MNNSTKISKVDIACAFNKAAKSYDQAAVVQKEIAARLDERLTPMRIEPKIILDVGAGTGILSQLVANRYPSAQLFSLDISDEVVRFAKQKLTSSQYHFLCADAESLPFKKHSVDLIVSNLVLHWCHDLSKVFQEIQRILKPDGLVLFSTLGNNTLKELRESWSAADSYVHVHEFVQMKEIGDTMLGLQFVGPVIETETITMQYKEPIRLLKDLKQIGAHNIAQGRTRGLTGKKVYQHFLNAYENYRSENGKYPATYEVIYGHAWGSDTTSQAKQKNGEIAIPLYELSNFSKK